MKKRLCLFAFVSLITVSSCSPRLSMHSAGKYPAGASEGEISLLDEDAVIPSGAKTLGTLTVSSRLFSSIMSGTYDKCLDLAKRGARKMGGNSIKITNHSTPRRVYDKHSLNADVLLLSEAPVVEVDVTHPNYASVWLYSYYISSPGYGYNVYLDDKWVYYMKPYTKTEIRIFEPGTYTLNAKVEKVVELPLTVELGKDYYIEASVSLGLINPNPNLFFVSEFSGKDACKRTKEVEQNE